MEIKTIENVYNCAVYFFYSCHRIQYKELNLIKYKTFILKNTHKKQQGDFYCQLVAVELMYDSRTKMVSSTWFSAESNLEEKEKKTHLKWHQKPPGWVCLFFFTCLYEGVRNPAAAAQER